MGICRLRLIALPLVLFALLAAPSAFAGRDAGLAALQVALQSRGLYAGAIDGVKGPGTTAAIKRFQRRAGLTPDGIPGTATRKALGRYGKHVLGSQAADARRERLGRRRAPVPARLARLPLGHDRRRPRRSTPSARCATSSAGPASSRTASPARRPTPPCGERLRAARSRSPGR